MLNLESLPEPQLTIVKWAGKLGELLNGPGGSSAVRVRILSRRDTSQQGTAEY